MYSFAIGVYILNTSFAEIIIFVDLFTMLLKNMSSHQNSYYNLETFKCIV